MGLLKQNSTLIHGIHQFLDLLIITAAFWAAYLTRGISWYPTKYFSIYAIAIICCHTSLRLFGCYHTFRSQTSRQIFSRIIKSSITGMSGIIFLAYLFHISDISRLFLGLFTAYLLLFLTAFKATVYYTLRHNRRKDFNTRKVLIIGSRARALDVIKEILANPGSGYRIFGCLETIGQKNQIGETVLGDISIVGSMADFETILLNNSIDEILFAIPLKKVLHIHKHILTAEKMGINIRIMPDFQIQRIMYYPETARVSVDPFLGMPTMFLSSTPALSTELTVKSAIDYTIAGIGFLLLLPLFIFIGAAIKLSSKGPVLFTQPRCGLNGREFKLYKFRTMVANAEALVDELNDNNEMDGPVFKMKNDPRITKIGHFLRKTSLDELPQLLNILQGEMSLVGPRPPLPSEVEKYRLWQRRKLSMKPGLTCIWQVSGRNDVSFEQWMRMDLEYIDNWSLLLDLKLLGLTVREVAKAGGH